MPRKNVLQRKGRQPQWANPCRESTFPAKKDTPLCKVYFEVINGKSFKYRYRGNGIWERHCIGNA